MGERGMGDLEQPDLEAEFPDWEFGYTISGRPYARRPRTSPPPWLTGEDWTDLRDEVRKYIAEHFPRRLW